MTKYKIVGVTNLLFGFFELSSSFIFITSIIPKLIMMYSDFGAEGPNLTLIYTMLGIVILMGIANVLLGIKLFSKTKNKEKYFNYALMLVGANFILGGLFVGIAVLSMITPVYNLSSQF